MAVYKNQELGIELTLRDSFKASLQRLMLEHEVHIHFTDSGGFNLFRLTTGPAISNLAEFCAYMLKHESFECQKTERLCGGLPAVRVLVNAPHASQVRYFLIANGLTFEFSASKRHDGKDGSNFTIEEFDSVINSLHFLTTK